MIYKKTLYLLSLIFFVQSASAVNIKATIDRNPVSINESFELTFSANESPDNNPDFSPLAENFEILNQRQQNNSSWVNGKSSQSISWVLNLLAKQTGQLTIPVISFGHDTSLPIPLIVTKSVTPSSNKNDDLFFEVEASPNTVYVQSQVLYTLRLYRKVQIAQASLSEPELADAIIEKLGEDKNYTTDLKGIAYVVTERKYAIFPQKSGTSTIEPLTLTAEVVTSNSSRFSGFFNRQSTKTKRVTSNAVTLTIKPAPAVFSGKRWIPAEYLHLEEKWSDDITQMKVGEPLTRTLTLLAKGTTVAQLPELHDEAANSQLKTYPDQPVIKERKDNDGLIALREEKIAFIPSKPGDYTLPAIEIPWFNTKTEKMEVARIPELKVVAIGTRQTQNSPSSFPATKIESIPSEPIIHEVENKFWIWLSAFLASGWLISLVLFFRKRKPKQTKPAISQHEIKLKENSKALKQACANNNKLATKDALLAWGKIQFNSSNLSAIASHCEAGLQDEILRLNQSLYSNQDEQWTGKKLFQMFTENIAQKNKSHTTNDGLEPFYKI